MKACSVFLCTCTRTLLYSVTLEECPTESSAGDGSAVSLLGAAPRRSCVVHSADGTTTRGDAGGGSGLTPGALPERAEAALPPCLRTRSERAG